MSPRQPVNPTGLQAPQLLRAVALMVAMAITVLLGACGGGGPDEPDVATPRVVCPAADNKGCA